MKKGQEKLDQGLTVKEIKEQLNILGYCFNGMLRKEPKVLKAALEYIIIEEEKKHNYKDITKEWLENAEKKKNNINES